VVAEVAEDFGESFITGVINKQIPFAKLFPDLLRDLRDHRVLRAWVPG
jgi:hypothetical protein